MTPSEYRKQEIETPMYYRVNVKQKIKSVFRGIQMEYRIVNKPEFLVAGYELKTTSKEGKTIKTFQHFGKNIYKKILGQQFRIVKIRANG